VCKIELNKENGSTVMIALLR